MTSASSSGTTSRVASRREVGGDPSLERGQARLLETSCVGVGERRAGELAERRPAPERERGLQRRSRPRGDEALEPLHVELLGLDAQGVAPAVRDDAVGAERLAEGVDVHLEGALGARRRVFVPDAVDQAVGEHDRVRVQQEQAQQRTRALAAERYRHAVVAQHFQRPQQPKLHEPVAFLKPTFGGS